MLGLVRSNPERFKQDIEEANTMVKTGRGNDIVSKKVWDDYPVTAATYLSLFADDSKAAVINFHISSDPLEAISKIKLPLFAIMGRKDDAIVVPIKETMDRITRAATNSPRVETKILGDANHGYTGDEQNLANEILKWVK